MIKKISVILVLTVCICLFSGCGNKNNNSSETVLPMYSVTSSDETNDSSSGTNPQNDSTPSVISNPSVTSNSSVSSQSTPTATSRMDDPCFTEEVTSENDDSSGFGRVAILGDSYSTFRGMMASNYTCWYQGGDTCRWGITAADLTWWGLVATETDSQFICNSSLSGSTVSRIRYGNYAEEQSFPERLKKDIDLTKIDTLFILGCTNDSWGNSPLGELKYSNFTEEDMQQTIPSYCYMLDYIKKKAPDVRVINIMNSGLKREVTDNIEKASKHYGYEFIQISDDLEALKLEGHPTAAGMRFIADQVEAFLK